MKTSPLEGRLVEYTDITGAVEPLRRFTHTDGDYFPTMGTRALRRDAPVCKP